MYRIRTRIGAGLLVMAGLSFLVLSMAGSENDPFPNHPLPGDYRSP